MASAGTNDPDRPGTLVLDQRTPSEARPGPSGAERPARDRRAAVTSTVLAASVFLVIQIYEISRRAPIGHDESVYLLRSRYYAGNTAPTGDVGYWSAYRAPGLPAILSVPMRFLGESVSLSRGIVALFGAGTIVLTAYVAGRLGGPRAAIVAPWVIVMVSAFTSYAHLLLLDVPGALFGVLAGALLLRSIDDDEVGWWPALAIPLVVMAGTYVRYGTITNIGAMLAAIVIARADLLLRAGHRLTNVVRLAAVAVLSGIGAYLVLMVPAFTGAPRPPYEAQREFRDAKGLSPWESYGDLRDLVWPNGSRVDEAFNWFTLSVVVIGVVLTGVAAALGSRRRAAATGAIALLLWIVGLNIGLGQIFGNYLGLGVPFLALLVAPGGAWLLDLATARRGGRSLAFAVGGLIAVLGATSALVTASDRVEGQANLDVYRVAGARLNALAPDQDCAIYTSYIQVAYYSDCIMRGWGLAVPGTYVVDASADVAGAVPRGAVDTSHIYLVLVENGKRQPVDDRLERFLADSETVFVVDARRPIDVRRVIDGS